MPGKMTRSDPRPSVRVTRGAGSGQHAGKTRTLMPVWDSSGESRLRAVDLESLQAYEMNGLAELSYCREAGTWNPPAKQAHA